MRIRRTRLGVAVAVGLVALGLAGCGGEVDPDAVTARVIASGEYELRGGLPVLVSPASTIPCEEGRTFGVDYRLEVADGQYGPIPIEFRWVHPELAVPSRRLWGRETEARKPNPVLEWRDSFLDGRVLWTFEHPDELVSGRYEFQIRRRVDGRSILSHAFEVVGC